jgi:ABC-2 type transport system permease protein
MTAASINIFTNVFDPARLFGPIFDKELRVSSRRRKNYTLRFVYIILLTIFLALAWLNAVQFIGSSALNLTARMADAGKTVIRMIVWFQFIVTQCIAVIMLSTSISDEIYNRTLGVLMSTPISSFQIVTGKLFSKLLQVVLLLAISLPVLAIVRVFGGVPWNYVISSLCITLTTIIFFGSVSLFFSIFNRKSYVVIILTALTLGILFGLPLFITGYDISDFFSWGRRLNTDMITLLHLNPYLTLNLSTGIMLNPRFAGRISYFFWPVHCGLMLAASVVVLSVCVLFVRKVALAQAAGYPTFLERLKRIPWSVTVKKTVPDKSNGQIRHVKGPPVIWKEMTSRLSSREKLFVGTIIGVEVIMIVAMYLFPVISENFGLGETYALYYAIFMGLGLLSITIFPATCIATEKEARTWPLLLTTTLTGWQILIGKCAGVLRRAVPAWMLLFIYLIPFLGMWKNNFADLLADLVRIVLLVSGMTIFLCGTGIYFSSRFRRSSTAVMTNFILAALVWGVIPYLLYLLMESFRIGDEIRDMLEYFMNAAPFVQAMEMMSGRSHNNSAYFIYGYMFLGLVFVWLAKRRLRSNIF